MNRIIIENRSNIDDMMALDVVNNVMSKGRISNDGKQYCYASTFKTPAVVVYTDLNKCSDRFIVCDLNENTKKE